MTVKKTGVHVYKCVSYDTDRIRAILGDYFDGIDFSGKKILLKPNMLQAHSPGECVTTHPAVLEAAALYFTGRGAACAIGDSPSGTGIENAQKASEETGMLDVCRRLGIDFDYFNGQPLVRTPAVSPKVYENIFLPESFFSYDVIINVPKLKTHAVTIFTLGVKNMMGLMTGSIKRDFHIRSPHPVQLAEALADLYSVAIPHYTIMDGVEGMHGDGPVSGKKIKLGRIFISSNTNALDAVIEAMCGVDPMKVPLTREISSRGFEKIDNIDIIKGYSGSDPEFDGFEIPLVGRFGARIPAMFFGAVTPFVLHKPLVDRTRCTGCRECIEMCPAGAISFRSGFPVFDLKKCVRCFCCAERCSRGAIREKKNFLTKLLP
ncbi:MAG: DUF362 domain-containing protein [Elusimicrobia bacterium]|nr:DUF362 domain-containing protein [Elusimicrobiota bacterium]